MPLCGVVDALLDVDAAALSGFHDERGDVGAEVQDEGVQAGACAGFRGGLWPG